MIRPDSHAKKQVPTQHIWNYFAPLASVHYSPRIISGVTRIDAHFRTSIMSALSTRRRSRCWLLLSIEMALHYWCVNCRRGSIRFVKYKPSISLQSQVLAIKFRGDQPERLCIKRSFTNAIILYVIEAIKSYVSPFYGYVANGYYVSIRNVNLIPKQVVNNIIG